MCEIAPLLFTLNMAQRLSEMKTSSTMNYYSLCVYVGVFVYVSNKRAPP